MAISSSLVGLGVSVGIFALLALGMNIKFGYTGLLAFGHVGFYLLGGYTTALLVLPPAAQSPGQEYILGLGLPWIVGILIATLFTGLVGALVSLPAIRLREDYLAITLLGIAFVIQQVFRSPNFRWLANGPRALTIGELPYQDLFPLPGSGPESAALFGVVVLVLFSIATYLTATLSDVGSPEGSRARTVHALIAASTLGVGYVLARPAAGEDGPDPRVAVLSGVVVGAVAALSVLLSLPRIVALAPLIGISVFTWVFGGVVLSRYYEEFTRRDHAFGLGLTLAFLATLLPLVILGSDADDATSALGLVASVVLVGGFVYCLYYLAGRWGRYGTDASPVRIIGIGAVWLFLLRYFVLSLIGPLTSVGTRGIGYAADQTLQNLVWLLKFDQPVVVAGPRLNPRLDLATAVFDYSRFLFTAVVLSVVLVYYLSEVMATSPFGRVLKAIREDEDVATALGKNTFVYKVQSMAVGSAFAGLAGGLTAIQFQSLTWQIFRVEVTFFVLLMVIIGGTANNRGVILGAAIFWAFDRATTDLATFFPTAAGSSIRALRLVIIGALLIVILYYRPEGVWGETAGIGEVSEE